MELNIDYEFENKIPPLSSEEWMRLEDSILTEGRLISPIVVWNGIIVDGHNRYRIIRDNPHIEYSVYEKAFSDRNEAIAWICRNQLGRRNLTPEQKKYLIGKQYEAEKQSVGGDRKSEEAKSMYQNDTSVENTGERIARQNNISRISVLRAEGFAKAVDLADEAVPGIRDEILSGAINAADAEIMKIAKAEPEKRTELAKKLREPKPTAPKKKPRYNPKDYGCDYGQPFSEGSAATEPPISGILDELNDVVETFIFRWDFQQEHYGHLFRDEECLTGVRKLIAEMNEYMQNLQSKYVE